MAYKMHRNLDDYMRFVHILCTNVIAVWTVKRIVAILVFEPAAEAALKIKRLHHVVASATYTITIELMMKKFVSADGPIFLCTHVSHLFEVSQKTIVWISYLCIECIQCICVQLACEYIITKWICIVYVCLLFQYFYNAKKNCIAIHLHGS